MVARPDYTQHGDSGTRRSGGRISGYERNTAITGFARWAAIADEMLAVDPKLAEAMASLSGSVLSAEWLWIPGPAKGQALEDRAHRLCDDFNAQWGFDGGTSWFSLPWETQLTQMVRYVPIGARYLEEVYGVRNGKVYLKKFADREPTSHSRWLWSADEKDWTGVEQLATTVGTTVRVTPSDKLLLLVHGFTGQNLEGRGALRPCYQWYSIKQHMMDLLAIAAERWAVPTPHVQIDRLRAQEAGYTSKEIDSAVAEAKYVAERYLSGEQAWLSSISGLDFKTFGEGHFDPAGLISSIHLGDQQMLSAWLLTFLEMGLGEVGSRSLGQVLQEQSVLAAVNVLDVIAAAINGQPRPGGGTAARLARWNDPLAAEHPEIVPILTHRGIKVNSLGLLLPHIPNLINSGALSPDDALENQLRVLGDVEAPVTLTRSVTDRLGGRVLSPDRVSNPEAKGMPEAPVEADNA